MSVKTPPKRYGVEFDLSKAIKSLDETKNSVFAHVQRAMTQALWYGWGRLDADPGQDSRLNAIDFSHFYAEERFLFDTGQANGAMSIQSAWDAYVQSVTDNA